MPFSSILCPVDVLDPGERGVLEYASRLADRLGASLHALHVYDVPGFIHPDPESAAVRSYAERALREHRERFGELIDHLPGALAQPSLLPGRPHVRIAEEVERLPVDLIVMGTHARGGVRRLVLGSVAERVVRSSAVPVLTVPRWVDPPAHAPTSILVPHDFSSHARRALELARDLHVPLRASVAAMHVLPPELSLAQGPPWLSDDERARYREALGSSLTDDVAEVFGPEAQAVRAVTAAGAVVDQLLEFQDQHDTDLLVVGASGKSGTERVLLGSVTIELLRRCPAPVVTVP